MTIKPNPAFETIRADEVAECWEGVSKELYQALWLKIVPHQTSIPQAILEDSGPHDHIGRENLASHWDKLSEAEQSELNFLAFKRDEEIAKWFHTGD